MSPPKRHPNHQTDSLAVRRLISSLSADWIIRDMSERDYGVDMMIEYFLGETPTGKSAFLQVKGTKATITETRAGFVSFYQFPVRTLLYAEQFPEPFFLIYLSTQPGEPIYYLWLQKYISTNLDQKQPGWRNENEILVSIPASNKLRETEERFLRMASHNVMMQTSMRFLSDYFFWEHHIDELLETGNFHMKSSCMEYLDKFESYGDFYKEILHGQNPYEDIDFKQAKSDLTVFVDFHRDYEARDALKDFRDRLSVFPEAILSADSLDGFLAEETDAFPY